MWLQRVTSLVDGLLLGCVYGLAAMGLSLIWGVMRVINLAHGVVMVLGMFAMYFGIRFGGLNPYLTLAPIALMGLLFGFAMYAVAVRRVVTAPYLSSLLATFAVNMMILGVGTALLTTSPRNVDFSLGALPVGPLSISLTRLIAAAATLIVTA
ncbi:MAG: hypothetical protein MUF51_07190, partial [Vicinamibacteria bacterium]|nr:hypothetical protein [Vicinamibacteria bacterium]